MLGANVIKRDHHPPLMVQRAFRELKVDGGRTGKEADIVLLRDGLQTVEAKQNGAPARFRGPFAAIIETKIDASAHGMLMGRPVRPRVGDLLADLAKWERHLADGLADAVFVVVMTADPEAYAGLDNVIAIPRRASAVMDWVNKDPIDPWPAIDAALSEVADHYRRYPVACIREKDFETRLFTRLRAVGLTPAKLVLPTGQVVAINPVRAQWSGEWASVLERGRRHDLVVIAPSGASLLAELELKTSHSDSHNWFVKREVEAELAAMHALVTHKRLDRARFVMFRYGKPLWEQDADTLFARYPHVEFAYHSA
jgi:hypothetical protein